MSIVDKKSILNYIAAISVIIFPASIVTVDNVAGLMLAIVVVIGVGQIIFQFKKLLPITRDEKLFFFSLSLLLVTAIVTTLANGSDFARADRFIILVLVIPAYYFFKFHLQDDKYLWIGLVVGSYVVLGVSVYLYQMLDPVTLWRATSASELVNKILFGDIALCLGGLSLAGVSWYMQQRKLLLVFPLLAFIAGVVASALSLTRGSWLAVPFLTLLFIWYSSRILPLKLNMLIIALFISMIGSIYVIPQTGVKKSINTTFNQIGNYISSQNVNDDERLTSVGARFEMWRAAGIIFLEKPLVGSGWGSYSEKAQVLVDAGLVNSKVSKFYHPHNQYISALAKGGLLGIAAVIVLFLFPAIIFLKVLRDSSDPNRHRLALAGLILIIGFVSFGFTESILERSKPIIFFSFYIAVFMALVQKKRKKI